MRPPARPRGWDGAGREPSLSAPRPGRAQQGGQGSPLGGRDAAPSVPSLGLCSCKLCTNRESGSWWVFRRDFISCISPRLDPSRRIRDVCSGRAEGLLPSHSSIRGARLMSSGQVLCKCEALKMDVGVGTRRSLYQVSVFRQCLTAVFVEAKATRRVPAEGFSWTHHSPDVQ